MAAIVDQAETPTELRPAVAGRNPWALAARRLRRNRIALAAGVLFLLIVAAQPVRAAVRALRRAHR